MALWSKDEDDTLRRMAKDGAFAKEIGAVLGRSRMSVQNRAVRIGLSLSIGGQRSRIAQVRKITPEVAARRNEILRAAAHKAMAPDVQAKRIAKIRATFAGRILAWCPPDKIEEYKALRRKSMTAAERKAAILADVRREHAATAKAKAAFDRSFEGQMARVRAGARIEQRLTRPANDLTFSPTGSCLA